MSGQTDDEWAYDAVGWDLYTPIDRESIDVVSIWLGRKSKLNEDKTREYQIEYYTINRGKLTKANKSQ